ncbi:MAG: RT0821/Lpp0805 family surface protein [Pseudomonadota bacterium]
MSNMPGKYGSKTPDSISLLHIEQECKPVNRIRQAVALSAAVMMLAGCSVSSNLGSVDTRDELVTTSVAKPVESEGIGSDDAEIIKTVVADADSSGLLAWQNPDTGNKGTITAIDRFTGSHGQQCKKFQTTVDTFMGISLYNGETCELRKGFWVLSWFLKADG